MEWLAHIVRFVLVRWGYLALAGGLLGENAGLPLPGETILMYSSFIARKSAELSLWAVVLIGIGAAILGDNLGYLAGRHFGPRLLRWLERKFHMHDDIATARNQIKNHGPATVFWARYIVGLRTVAGPVAGALHMPWREFLLFNALGAATWVTAVSLSGYLFAQQFHSLAGYIEKVSWGISAGLFTAGYLYWRRQKKRLRQQRTSQP